MNLDSPKSLVAAGLFLVSSSVALALPPTVELYAVPDVGDGPLEVRLVVRAVEPDGMPLYCKLSYRGDASPFEKENRFVVYPPYPELVFTHVYDSSDKDYTPTLTCQSSATVSDVTPLTVRTAPTNAAPRLVLEGPKTPVDASLGVSIVIDASDADGDPLSCTIDWGEFGSTPSAATIAAPHPDQTVNHSFRRPGRYRVQGLCADDRGASVTHQVLVDIVATPGNSIPNLDLRRLTSVIGVAPYAAGFRVQSVFDANGDTLACVFDAKDGLGPREFTMRPPYTAVDFTATYTHEIELDFPTLFCSDGRGGYRSDSDSIVVTVPGGNSEPVVTLSVDRVQGASPLTAKLTVAASDPNGDALRCNLGYGFEEGSEEFQIQPGAGPRTFEHVYREGDVYQARVVCNDAKGGHGEDAAWIDVDPFDAPDNYLPIVRFRPSRTAGDFKLPVTFYVTGADADGGDIACDLDFGDGFPRRAVVLEAPLYTAEAVPHVYYTASSTPYSASLVCRDAQGATRIESVAISVSRPATAAVPQITKFEATPTSGTAPLEVTFSFGGEDADSASLNCTLDFGNGSRYRIVAADPFVVHRGTVYQPGSYTARLYCCDDVPVSQTCGPSNIAVATRSLAISAGTPNGGNQAPVVQLDVASFLIDATFTVRATDPDGDVLDCSLAFGDGSAADRFGVSAPYAAVTRVHRYPELGDYAAGVVCRDSQGAEASAQRTVKLVPRSR